MTEDQPDTGSIIRAAIIFEGGILVVAVVLGWLINNPPLPLLQMTWAGMLMGIFATGPLLMAMWWCSRSTFGPLKELLRQVDELLVPLFLGASSRTLLLISVLAGLGEECLFRGVLQSALSTWFGMPVALAATSVLFGLAHLITPAYAVLAGLIGAYLGALAVATDNLLVPIVAHALYDFMALTYLVNVRRRERVT
jgi:membrane protease YdiL (CAAX protease family)